MPVLLDRTKRVVEPFRLALATQRVPGEVAYQPYARPGLH